MLANVSARSSALIFFRSEKLLYPWWNVGSVCRFFLFLMAVSYGMICNRLPWKYLDSFQRMNLVFCSKCISFLLTRTSEAIAPLICTSLWVLTVCVVFFMKRETNTLSVLSLLRHLTEWTMHFLSHNSFLLLGDWLILFLAPSALHGICFSLTELHFIFTF